MVAESVASTERQVSIATTSSSSLSEARPDFHDAPLARTSIVETTWAAFDEGEQSPRVKDEGTRTSTTTTDLKKQQIERTMTPGLDPVSVLQRKIMSCLQNLDERMYSGGGEQDQLLEAYKLMKLNSNCETTCNVVLITGPERSSTSALAHSLRHQVEKDGGYMVSGRFDGVRTCPVKPYRAFVDAFTQFTDQVVAEGEEAVEQLRTAIEENIVVGTNILTDMIPSLTRILGEEKPDARGRAVHRGGNAMSRFVVVFKAFLGTITARKPLVLVLEDIHLADPCSVMLMQVLAAETGVSLVCTSRSRADGVIDGASCKLRKGFMDANVVVKNIPIQKLTSDDVDIMVADILSLPKEKIVSLAKILSTKTQGNAVFVIEAIKSLQEERLLTYKDDSWSWDEAQVLEQLQVESFGEFLSQRCTVLPPQLKELLKVASCLGSKLDEDMLSHALSAPVGHYLALAADRGLLKCDPQTGKYTFSHDGIQSASYELIEPKEREKFHLAIARRLCRCLDREEMEEHVFVILDQFQRGKGLIGKHEKYVAVDLSLQGAQRAFRSSSFRIAAECLTFGISLLDRSSFKDEYNLCLALHTNAAEVYFIMADDVRMDESIDTVLQNALCFKDKLGALTTHVYALGTRNRSCEAVEVAHGVLAELGVAIERSPSKLGIMAEFKRVKKLLKNRTDQSILRMQRMTDPDKLAALQVLNVLFLNAYIAESKGAPLIGLKMVELTLQHGLCAASSFGFAIYAFLVSNRDVDQGCAYARLALAIVDRFNAKEWIPRVHLLVYGGILAWQAPAAECLSPLKEGHKIGLETGDHEYSMLCANFYADQAMLIRPADEVLRECNKFAHQMVISKQDVALGWMESIQTTLKVLMGEAPYSSVDESCPAKEGRNDPKTKNMYALVQTYNKMYLSYIFQDVDAGGILARRCWEQLLKKDYESQECSDFAFICGLASAAVMRRTNDRRERATHNKILKGAIKKFRSWSKTSPHSTYSKLFLLQAEEASLRHQDSRAAGKYLVAIATAESVGYLYEVAMGNENAGRFYLSRGKKEVAVPYYTKALEAYSKAKATGKAKNLRQELDLLHEGMLGASVLSFSFD